MKYLSEITGEKYDTPDECIAEEQKYLAKKEAEKKAAEEKANARKERAAEVNEAFKAAQEAQNHYIELRNKFVDDFGSFHATYSTKEPVENSKFFDSLFGDLLALL